MKTLSKIALISLFALGMTACNADGNSADGNSANDNHADGNSANNNHADGSANGNGIITITGGCLMLCGLAGM